MSDPYRSADFLPPGTVIDGWNGTAARDHLPNGLYAHGPQPACPPWHRLMGHQSSPEEPLPPGLAVILTLRERVRMCVTRTTIRQALPRAVPVHREASEVKRRLRPLLLGKRRFGVQG